MFLIEGINHFLKPHARLPLPRSPQLWDVPEQRPPARRVCASLDRRLSEVWSDYSSFTHLSDQSQQRAQRPPFVHGALARSRLSVRPQEVSRLVEEGGGSARSPGLACWLTAAFTEQQWSSVTRRARGFPKQIPPSRDLVPSGTAEKVCPPATTDGLLLREHQSVVFHENERTSSGLCTLAHIAFCKKAEGEPERHSVYACHFCCL